MPADIDTIMEFLDSPRWTESEKWVIKWQFNANCHFLGDFETALAKAITLADDGNLLRLAAGFPMQVGGYLLWSHGPLGRQLREAGLGI